MDYCELTSLAERSSLLEAVNDLRREHLLDWTGGAISVRVGEAAMLITPGGSARRLWKLDMESLIVLSLEKLTTSTGARPPTGAVLHQFLYRELPDVRAIVHTHAGYCYTVSCTAPMGLPVLPPTSPLGTVPCISGTTTEKNNPPSSQADWVRDITIPAVKNYILSWTEATQEHGIVFFDREHGAYSLGRSLDAALVDIARLESSSRLWLQAANDRDLPSHNSDRPKLPN